eukprot:462584_1
MSCLKNIADSNCSFERNPTELHLIMSSLPIHAYIVFAIFSIGPSYVLLDSSWVQVPYFQFTQPEGQKLATYMTAAATIPSVTLVPLYYVIININWPNWHDIPYRIFMHIAGISVIIIAIILTFFWDFVIFHTSVIILICVFFAATIGSTQGIALIPWITTVNPKLVAAILSGNAMGVCLAAAIGLIQNPGDQENALFNPTAFYSIWIGVLIISYFVWIFIDKYYLENVLQPIKNIEFELSPSRHEQTPNASGDQAVLLKNIYYNTDGTKRDVWEGIKFTFKIPVWWRSVIKYCVYNIYLQFGVWILVRSTLPFAAAHTTQDNSGEIVLSYAINVGYVALLMGSLLATVYQIYDFTFCMIIFTMGVMVFFFYLFDHNPDHFKWNGNQLISQIVLVADCFMLLFLNGYVAPLIHRRIGELYPQQCEGMNRWLSAMEKVTTFPMIWIAFVLVQQEYIH